jgi:glycosyltransferase involved in cell wall biosynthesis
MSPWAPDPSSPHLKVLLVTHELSLTGSPRLALEVFRAIGSGVDLYTISGSGGNLESRFQELGPVRILKRIPGRWGHSHRPAPSLLAKVVGHLQAPVIGVRASAWRPDVVCVNSVAAITLVSRLRLRGIPVLLYVHELGAAMGRLTAEHRNLLVTLPDRYVAVSSVAADELAASHGVDRDRVSVIPPIVDVTQVEEMADAKFESTEDASSSGFLIGGAGNPHWTKGIESWLQMARALIDRLGPQDVCFEWVGVRRNTAAAEFRAMIRKLALDDNVRLVDENANPYQFYRRFDVFAMTSWEESASLAVLENMALGVPVVCFRGSGGPPEQIGDAGVVLDRFSPSSMADSVAELLANADLRAGLAARARARVATVNAPGRVAELMFNELAIAAGRLTGA